MSIDTFTETTLWWFDEILDDTIISLHTFSRIFKEQFSANKIKPPRKEKLFDITDEGDSLKSCLNRFCEVSVHIQQPNKEMVVDVFVKGLRANPFSELLLRN